MDLQERTIEVAAWLKRTKSEWIATRPENTDIAIYLHFYRGDDLVVVLMCPLDRDRALFACRAGCAGFAADTVAIAFESYHTGTSESPITGKPWMPGEMQFIFETYPEAIEKGWVNECITISMHERGGDFTLYSMPYRIRDDPNGAWVDWAEEVFSISSGVEGESGGGLMFDALQDAMRLPTLEESIRKQADQNMITKMVDNLVHDPEVRNYHTDFATYRTLKQKNLVNGIIFFAKEGSERAALLEDRVKTDPTLQNALIIIELQKGESDAAMDDDH